MATGPWITNKGGLPYGITYSGAPGGVFLVDNTVAAPAIQATTTIYSNTITPYSGASITLSSCNYLITGNCMIYAVTLYANSTDLELRGRATRKIWFSVGGVEFANFDCDTGTLTMLTTTGTFKPPSLTTTQRNALTGVEGMVLYNNTTHKLTYHNGTTWVEV